MFLRVSPMTSGINDLAVGCIPGEMGCEKAGGPLIQPIVVLGDISGAFMSIRQSVGLIGRSASGMALMIWRHFLLLNFSLKQYIKLAS